VPGLGQPPIRVRASSAEDDSFIERLAAQAFTEYARYPGHSTLEMARTGRTWIVERAGSKLGFAVVHGAGAPRAELCAIAVAEAARGTGVGAALLERVELDLARAGTSELGLHTAQANSSALDLFVKRGFAVERQLPRFYRGVFDACAMRKRIA